MNTYEKIYNILTEVSIKAAAQAAANARKEQLAKGSRPRYAQIARVKAKFTQRAIKKHGEAGTKTVLGRAGEVPAELGGGRHERSKKQVTKRTLYSGGRRETRAQTVARKFDKKSRWF